MAGSAAQRKELDATTHLTNPALHDFWEEVFLGQADIAVLHGGRSSSKTRDTACQLVRLVDHVAVRMRVLCIRRFQNRIQDSVYTELKWAINHLGLQAAYNVQKTTIIHRRTGAEFIFYGIERNLEDIKGTSDVDILWVEEAEKLTEEQWTVIGPTIRKEDSLAILLFNPKLVTDYVWKNFVVNTPPHTVVHKIDWTDNPFLSQKALRDIAAMQAANPELFEHIYGGVPLGDGELSIFKRRWLDACVDAHTVLKISLTGRNIIGFDPADDGEDKCATADKIEGVFTDAEDWSSGKDELVQNAKKVWAKAKLAGATVSYDTIGVGAFVGGYIDEQNSQNASKVKHYAFHAGGAVMDPDKPSDALNKNSPLNKDEYLNLKAQAWANTARRAMLTFNAVTRGHAIKPEDVLSFSSAIDTQKLDALFTELCVPWWVETEGKKRVVPKAKLKKDLGVKSHNLADAVIAADNVHITGSTYTLSNIG
ncbi:MULTISPECIES: PBSX family phage terminase large subunit [unclassified Shinella]|uniref:PBSX family phage terminase large subunit n=1 Tax=unclassified Shinella TaxID=2643062 RepID=UPI00234E619D|nr:MULTISPECIES: PBSX family phage terminase large subunit [unclassified Shinella]MCO5152568.1 PBSX family phage terminase large subunit [Shinella sp.]MDC7261863.1 PBSX family phage terminase large subunit [Shinella sp. HY16]MDC7268758.1 PBSX family phage terminase large subunit [Shinella sp. YZ44]